MFLEFNLPIRINLFSSEKENLNNTFINFNYIKYNCFLKLKSEKDIIENKENEKIIYTQDYHGISGGSNRDRHPFFDQEKESYLTINRDTSHFFK